MESTTDIKIWVNLTIMLSKRTQNRKKKEHDVIFIKFQMWPNIEWAKQREKKELQSCTRKHLEWYYLFFDCNDEFVGLYNY